MVGQGYLVLAFYRVEGWQGVDRSMSEMSAFLSSLDARGRIYFNEDGINAQLSIAVSQRSSFYDYLEQVPFLKEVEVQEHRGTEHPFPYLVIKRRQQLVALDQTVDLSLRGTYLSPQEWKEELDHQDPHRLILDVRNGYEWDVGHFRGSTRPNVSQFREFPRLAKELLNMHMPSKTKVLMSCTGGIRCEYYSALLKAEGFEEVYHLRGGMIGYGLQVGNDHFSGKLFVFDDRLVVSIDGDEEGGEVIGSCAFCSAKTDRYYNCAHMACNALFLSCPDCIEPKKGCCSTHCAERPHLRRVTFDAKRPKPFRRLSTLAQTDRVSG